MSIFKVIIKEAIQRKANSFLSIFTIGVTVAMFTALVALNDSLQKQTIQQMKALGFNLAIIPINATPEDYFNSEFGGNDLPESYIERLAKAEKITADHFSGRLEKRIEWQGHTAILTGIMATRVREQKAPLGIKNPPEPGTVYCGFEIARFVEVQKTDDGRPKLDAKGNPILKPITIMGEQFKVAKRLARRDLKEDIRIYMNLSDAQRLLNKPGRIHLIEALGCRCQGDVIAQIQKEIETILNKNSPERDRAKILIPDEPKFYTREKMRAKVEGFAAVILPSVLFACIIWIGSLSYLNVRQRRTEIGLLRAIGVGSAYIAELFLIKAALVGIIGALLGFFIGSSLAIKAGTAIFELQPDAIGINWINFLWAMLSAPIFSIFASLIPTVIAVGMDPAEALREE